MGLDDFLARRAVRVAHVLVVASPGYSRVRMLTECALNRLGWVLALSPAEADVLFVCGAAGSRLQATLDHVWEQMPGPRARVSALSPADVESALATAAAVLEDGRGQRDNARGRPPGPPDLGGQHSEENSQHDDGTDHGSSDSEHTDHSDSGHEGMDHEDSGHDEVNHGDSGDEGMGHEDSAHDEVNHGDSGDEGMDHAHMDHGDMDMAPDGIALAEGAEDEDGLSLDALTVPLGPILAHWPAGLVLTLTLHGDRIADADAAWLDSHDGAGDGGSSSDDDDEFELGWRAARHCDDAARLLSVAGWESAADAARRHRDSLLSSPSAAAMAGSLERLADRVDRSRILRWALRGLTVPDADGTEVELFTRPGRWLRDARATVDGTFRSTGPEADPLPELAARVVGLDIASARMIVAGCARLHRGGVRDRV